MFKFIFISEWWRNFYRYYSYLWLVVFLFVIEAMYLWSAILKTISYYEKCFTSICFDIVKKNDGQHRKVLSLEDILFKCHILTYSSLRDIQIQFEIPHSSTLKAPLENEKRYLKKNALRGKNVISIHSLRLDRYTQYF